MEKNVHHFGIIKKETKMEILLFIANFIITLLVGLSWYGVWKTFKPKYAGGEDWAGIFTLILLTIFCGVLWIKFIGALWT